MSWGAEQSQSKRLLFIIYVIKLYAPPAAKEKLLKVRIVYNYDFFQPHGRSPFFFMLKVFSFLWDPILVAMLVFMAVI